VHNREWASRTSPPTGSWWCESSPTPRVLCPLSGAPVRGPLSRCEWAHVLQAQTLQVPLVGGLGGHGVGVAVPWGSHEEVVLHQHTTQRLGALLEEALAALPPRGRDSAILESMPLWSPERICCGG
jgi:hypothetical protein